MYGNFRPSDEYRTEDNPHEPTNVPEGLEERCHRLFEHVETWSVNAGAVKFVYPKTEEGYNDYELMLDEMEFYPGNIHVYKRGTKDEKRLITIERTDVTVNWGERYRVERGGVKVLSMGDDNEVIHYTPGEGHSPKSLWKGFIYGKFEIGSINDL